MRERVEDCARFHCSALRMAVVRIVGKRCILVLERFKQSGISQHLFAVFALINMEQIWYAWGAYYS